jgi:hypothetical protein
MLQNKLNILGKRSQRGCRNNILDNNADNIIDEHGMLTAPGKLLLQLALRDPVTLEDTSIIFKMEYHAK